MTFSNITPCQLLVYDKYTEFGTGTHWILCQLLKSALSFQKSLIKLNKYLLQLLSMPFNASGGTPFILTVLILLRPLMYQFNLSPIMEAVSCRWLLHRPWWRINHRGRYYVYHQAAQGSKLLVDGNSNTYLSNTEGTTHKEDITVPIATYGLEGMSAYFLPRQNPRLRNGRHISSGVETKWCAPGITTSWVRSAINTRNI